MITKLIKVWIKPGHRDAYLAAQGIWNRETSKAPGYLGCLCTEERKQPGIIYLHLFWRSRGDLERWMATDHDRIAALAKADDHYERIETHILEDALPSQMPADVLSLADTLEAADVQACTEIYRAAERASREP